MSWRSRLTRILNGDLVGLLVLALCVLAILLAVSCTTTVAPQPAKASVASWDGTNQNSGFIGYLPDGRGLITESACRRYNGLIGPE